MSSNFIRRLTRRTLRRIVRSTVERQKKTDSVDELFGRSWASLSSNRFYLWLLRRYVTDKEQFSINSESLEFIIRTQPELFRLVKISASPALIEELRSDILFIVAQIHDGPPSLTKFLVDQKLTFSRIVRDPARHLKRLKDMEVDTSYMNLIRRDVRSFSRLRTAVQHRQIICCAIDYRNENGKWAYLNPAIFGFAEQLKLPVIFTKSDVDGLGQVNIRASGPHAVTEPISTAMAFKEFYNSTPGRKIDLVVKRYYE